MSGLILDVSNNNSISGHLLAASHAVGLICKATEGTSFHDKTYPVHRSVAKYAGIPFGGYLFLHPDSPGNEAEFFHAYAAPHPGDFQPIVDSETVGALGMKGAAKRTVACLQELTSMGYAPIWYSSLSMAEAMISYARILNTWKFWQAQYASARTPIGRGVEVVMWQFSETYQVQNRRFDASRLMVPIKSLLIPKGR